MTGFQKDVTGYWIEKDPQAQLVYTLDWSEWLLSNDEIASVVYSVTHSASPAPVNDLTIVSSGASLTYTTYVELSKGIAGEIYTVTAKVTTVDGLTDARRFRVKVKERHAQ